MLYSNREPPLEIRHVPNLATGEKIGYVTFVLFPRHFQTPERAYATVSTIQLFRDYLHYHSTSLIIRSHALPLHPCTPHPSSFTPLPLSFAPSPSPSSLSFAHLTLRQPQRAVACGP